MDILPTRAQTEYDHYQKYLAQKTVNMSTDIGNVALACIGFGTNFETSAATFEKRINSEYVPVTRQLGRVATGESFPATPVDQTAVRIGAQAQRVLAA